MPRDPERFPYEYAIEDLVKEHFGLFWSFKAARELPYDEYSLALMAIRRLVYEVRTEAFNQGIEFQKSGKEGMHV